MNNKNEVSTQTQNTQVSVFENKSLSTGQLSVESLTAVKNALGLQSASEEDLKLFAACCNKTGLDPFSRQIYGMMQNVKDKSGNWTQKLTIMTSIDGFRLIAERTGKYRGQRCWWCGKDGKWLDIWLDEKPPVAAKVEVYREDYKNIDAIALFKSYKPSKDSYIWEKMPELMISKCAEALALRKGFPNELSGIYTSDEMQQAQTQEEKQEQIKRDYMVHPKTKEPFFNMSLETLEKVLTYFREYKGKTFTTEDLNKYKTVLNEIIDIKKHNGENIQEAEVVEDNLPENLDETENPY